MPKNLNVDPQQKYQVSGPVIVWRALGGVSLAVANYPHGRATPENFNAIPHETWTQSWTDDENAIHILKVRRTKAGAAALSTLFVVEPMSARSPVCAYSWYAFDAPTGPVDSSSLLEAGLLASAAGVASKETIAAIPEQATTDLVAATLAPSTQDDLFKLYSRIATAPLYIGDATRRY